MEEHESVPLLLYRIIMSKSKIESLSEELVRVRGRKGDLQRIIDQMNEFGLDTDEAERKWDALDDEEDELLEKLESLTE